MPNTESPIRRSAGTFLGSGAKNDDETETNNDPWLKGIQGRPIPSGSITELEEKYSFPKVPEIIEREFEYRDKKFPADSSSLGACKSLGNRDIEWKRPRDMTKNPKFFDNESSEFDFAQGPLKNSWFLAAVASLATRKDTTGKRHLLQQVVPMDQSFDEHGTGIFHFRFWQYGKWVDVVVDDYLPTYYEGEKLRLFGAQPAPENTFWLPLLEKAYAKLHGSYQAIERPGTSDNDHSTGRSGDAMEDFTGGISDFYPTEYIKSDEDDEFKVRYVRYDMDFYDISKEAWENQSLVTCYIKDWEESGSKKTGSHHCSVKGFDSMTSEVEVVRIRHSDAKNSNGSEPEASKLIPKEFFNKNCTSVEICHLNLKKLDPDSSTDSAKKAWYLCEIHGEWRRTPARGDTQENGSRTNFNPRYCFKLEQKGNVIISLMRKPPSENDPKGQDPLRIGFEIYSVPDDYTVIPYPLDKTFFDTAKQLMFEYYNSGYQVTPKVEDNWKAHIPPKIAVPKTKSAPDSMQHNEYTRESNCRLKFNNGGCYCLVVDNGDAKEGDFFLRIFSQNPITIKEDTPFETVVNSLSN